MHLSLFAYTYIKIIIYALFKLYTRFVLWSWNFPSTLLRSKRQRPPKPFKYVAFLMRMLTWVTISANYHNCILWIRCHIASLGANAGFCLVKGVGDFDSSGQSEVDRQPCGIPMPSSSGPPEWLQPSPFPFSKIGHLTQCTSLSFTLRKLYFYTEKVSHKYKLHFFIRKLLFVSGKIQLIMNRVMLSSGGEMCNFSSSLKHI